MNNFYKSKLMFDTVTLIAHERQPVLRDLIAYSNDPVRYARRFRTLAQLSQYEHDIIIKIQNFETNDPADLSAMSRIKDEILSIVNSAA